MCWWWKAGDHVFPAVFSCLVKRSHWVLGRASWCLVHLGSMGTSLKTGNCRLCKRCAKSPHILKCGKQENYETPLYGVTVFVKRSGSLIILILSRHFSKGELYWGTLGKFLKWVCRSFWKKIEEHLENFNLDDLTAGKSEPEMRLGRRQEAHICLS